MAERVRQGMGLLVLTAAVGMSASAAPVTRYTLAAGIEGSGHNLIAAMLNPLAHGTRAQGSAAFVVPPLDVPAWFQQDNGLPELNATRLHARLHARCVHVRWQLAVKFGTACMRPTVLVVNSEIYYVLWYTIVFRGEVFYFGGDAIGLAQCRGCIQLGRMGVWFG